MSDKEVNKLQHKYDVWFRGSRGKVVTNSQNYDQNLKIIASFDTVQSFWDVYSYLARPNDLAGLHCDLHVFKSGIKPLWEDDANKDGGVWKLRLRKSVTTRLWEDLLLALIGEQFGGDDVCGVVISCRFHEDYLCVWNRNGSDLNAKNKIRDTLKRVLKLPPNVPLEYKQHSDALKKINTRTAYNKTNNKINLNQ